jgi:hypothetical protein
MLELRQQSVDKTDHGIDFIPTNPWYLFVLLTPFPFTVQVIIHGSSKPEGIHHINAAGMAMHRFSMSIYRRYAKAGDEKGCVYKHLSKPHWITRGRDAHRSTVVLLLVLVGYSEPVDTGVSTQNACPRPSGEIS